MRRDLITRRWIQITIDLSWTRKYPQGVRTCQQGSDKLLLSLVRWSGRASCSSWTKVRRRRPLADSEIELTECVHII